MKEFHYCQLIDPSRSVNTSHQKVLRSWLKVTDANMEIFLLKTAKRHLVKVIANEPCIEEKNDLGLTSTTTAKKVIFKERVKIYRFWLNKHKRFIGDLINDMTDSDRRLVSEELLKDQELANSDILSDEILVKYMSNENVCTAIKECVELENKNCKFENNYIRAWLINKFTKTVELLDAIELMTEKKKESSAKLGISTDVKVYNSRHSIDDSDSCTNTSDSLSSETEEESNSETEMNSINDIGMTFKKMSRNYKLHENKEIQMLQRAERLRIDLSEKQDDEEDDWQEHSNTMLYGEVFKLLKITEPFTNNEAADVSDIWKLSLRDRYKLYKLWVQSKKETVSKKLIVLTEEYKVLLHRKTEAKSLKDIAILQQARVIGMTTFEAAKRREILQSIGCRIIIVEEAAQALEAQIVTALNNKCQHLILIGDHQQLRPSPIVHRLAVDYNLDISLFERLIKNGVPHVTLTEQHRMRPEISQFIKHIYPNLEDHYSVTGYDDIRGVNSNVFFLQHSFEESKVHDSTDISNLHEAQFITALCKYFLQHGYLGKQITILADNGGQVSCIKNEMKPENDFFEGVRVTSIDNYQGEENIIRPILVSLVRSNKDNKVGFLKTDNRVCVALSRAKKGMFVIGNLPLLAKKSKLWRNILTQAQDERVTGINMKLVCVNHANHITYVQSAQDFSSEVPEGGCNRKCNALLPCGHICPRMCHASDRHHEESQCEQPCMKTCPKDHLCQKKCGETCGDCEVIVKKRMRFCRHEDDVPCSRDVFCPQLCEQTLACGHICNGQCGKCLHDGDHQPCLEKVILTWPFCHHTATVECKTDVLMDPCPDRCLERLDCGHICKGTCGNCLSGRVHQPCPEKCRKSLPCGHPCNGPCGGQCVPCDAKCVVFCRHGPCNKNTCGELCDPCTENCALTCQHKECNLRCMDECRISSCNEPCDKHVSKCQHRCYSLCGEPCVCYPCEKEKLSLIDNNDSGTKTAINTIALDKLEGARNFECESKTILIKIQKCGHIFVISQLDKYVESLETRNTSFITCPSCLAPILGIARYEHINKKRTENRENLKADLIRRSSVPTKNIGILKAAKESAGTFCHIDKDTFLTWKPKEIDANPALALSLQIRFANVLAQIYTIDQDFSRKGTFEIGSLKLIINSINRHVTAQFFKEMTLELHRLLLHLQIHILTSYLQDIDRELPAELNATCKLFLKNKKQKLTAEDKVAFQGIVGELYKSFDGLKSKNYWQVQTLGLREKSEKITRILEQPMDSDLTAVIG